MKVARSVRRRLLLRRSRSVANPEAEKLIIVLRQSPDWAALADGADYDYRQFDELVQMPPGTTASLVAWWDSSFPIGLFRTRLRMKEIAGESITRVRDASIIDIADFAPPFDDKALYAFTDDDDWFAPDLAARLLNSPAARADGSVWVSSVFSGGSVKAREHTLLCFTNNYAMHGAFMNRYKSFRYGRPVARVAQHVGANRVLRKPEARPVLLAESFSVTNKHPATYTIMAQARDGGIAPSALLESYRRPVELSDIDWSEHAAEQTTEFFLRLLEASTPPQAFA